MDIPVAIGEWINTLRSLMDNAADGDCFCLPTTMHLHAFVVTKETYYPTRDFKVELKEQTRA
jgi:hypothetical protein